MLRRTNRVTSPGTIAAPPPGLIDRSVVHYAQYDPRVARGGVETFAQTLGRIFREVLFMTPHTLDLELVRARRLPVICDNHWGLDWPEEVPVIGFQHGVAWKKFLALKDRGTWSLARRQARAARRANTLWVASARWVGTTFGELYGNPAQHVVHNPVDTERFDGCRGPVDSRLVLHDGRTRHKGSAVFAWLREQRPNFRFETLDCAPEAVPERMRHAAAFLHLSSYEGNSVVCNEAMAMNLPCLFTEVGLMREGVALDVETLPRSLVYGPFARFRRAQLLERIDSFLASLDQRTYAPRAWVEQNASIPVARARWAEALRSFDALPWR